MDSFKAMSCSAAVSEDPGVPETLMDMLRRASVLEEHRALMVAVVKKVVSAKSGLNEAFMSLLRGFEVCDVVLPTELYWQNAPVVYAVAPETRIAFQKKRSEDRKDIFWC